MFLKFRDDVNAPLLRGGLGHKVRGLLGAAVAFVLRDLGKGEASLGLPKENADGLVRALNHLRLLPFGEIKAISPRC